MSEISQITGKQLAAARALAGIGQVELAKEANISAPTIRRMEAAAKITGMTNNVAAVIRVLESRGIQFINGQYSGDGGPGVRLAPQPTDEGIRPQDLNAANDD